MEKITVNGKDYIDFESHELMLKEANHSTNAVFKEINCMMDEADVMGLGTVSFTGNNWVKVRVSTKYLVKAIKIMNEVSCLKKGRESIDIAFSTDVPLVIGEYDEKKGKMSGVIIAPRIPST